MTTALFPFAFISLDPWAMFTIGFALLIFFAWYFTTDSERTKRIVGSVLTVVMTFLAVVSFYPPFDAPGVKGKISQGIDLKGGTSFLIQVKPGLNSKGVPQTLTPDMLERVIETIR